jgi:hypothetical protein
MVKGKGRTGRLVEIVIMKDVYHKNTIRLMQG